MRSFWLFPVELADLNATSWLIESRRPLTSILSIISSLGSSLHLTLREAVVSCRVVLLGWWAEISCRWSASWSRAFSYNLLEEGFWMLGGPHTPCLSTWVPSVLIPAPRVAPWSWECWLLRRFLPVLSDIAMLLLFSRLRFSRVGVWGCVVSKIWKKFHICPTHCYRRNGQPAANTVKDVRLRGS